MDRGRVRLRIQGSNRVEAQKFLNCSIKYKLERHNAIVL
jgi:hypothetical protein